MISGIIGYGYVGNAVHAILNQNTIIYDINIEKYKDNWKILVDKNTHVDILFICLPTPAKANGDQDDSIISKTFDNLIKNDYSGIVVIKSTLLHKTIDKYSEKLNIVFNPEFLNQNSYIKDSINQETVILGGTMDNTKIVHKFYEKYTSLPKNTNYEFMTIKDAIDFKYTRNIYSAYKVLFWEFIEDTTGNSRKMSDLLSKIPHQSEMNQIGMDGFRGYGGACLPKDVKAWDKHNKHSLTQFMIKYNDTLNKIQ